MEEELLRELKEGIQKLLPEDGEINPVEGLYLTRASDPGVTIYGVVEPSLCVIAQGSKAVYLGKDRYLYDARHYLLTTLELPVSGYVVDASPSCPYVSMRIRLTPHIVRSVFVDAGVFPAGRMPDRHALAVSSVDIPLLDASLRLLRLLESPDDYPYLSTLIIREIIFRLLKGEQAQRLRYLTVGGEMSFGLCKVIAHMRSSLGENIPMEELAREAGMSVSGFHHHFKLVTSLSPLQFLKQLKLQEARRLLLCADLDVGNTACRVGYEDLSQFTREYKRMFGLPPTKDLHHLRNDAQVI